MGDPVRYRASTPIPEVVRGGGGMNLVDFGSKPCEDIELDLELELDLMLCRIDGAEAIIAGGMLSSIRSFTERGSFENVESESSEGVGDPMSEEDDECRWSACPFPFGRSF